MKLLILFVSVFVMSALAERRGHHKYKPPNIFNLKFGGNAKIEASDRFLSSVTLLLGGQPVPEGGKVNGNLNDLISLLLELLVDNNIIDVQSAASIGLTFGE